MIRNLKLLLACTLGVVILGTGLHLVEQSYRLEKQMEDTRTMLNELAFEQGLVEQEFTDEFIIELIETGVAQELGI